MPCHQREFIYFYVSVSFTIEPFKEIICAQSFLSFKIFYLLWWHSIVLNLLRWNNVGFRCRNLYYIICILHWMFTTQSNLLQLPFIFPGPSSASSSPSFPLVITIEFVSVSTIFNNCWSTLKPFLSRCWARLFHINSVLLDV